MDCELPFALWAHFSLEKLLCVQALQALHDVPAAAYKEVFLLSFLTTSFADQLNHFCLFKLIFNYFFLRNYLSQHEFLNDVVFITIDAVKRGFNIAILIASFLQNIFRKAVFTKNVLTLQSYCMVVANHQL